MEEELLYIVKDQFYTQKKQSKIINDVKITPNEVKEFYNQLDDIPLVPTKLELSQLVISPVLSEEKQQNIKDKLNNFRKEYIMVRILKYLQHYTLMILFLLIKVESLVL